jgi:hypothetical protein
MGESAPLASKRASRIVTIGFLAASLVGCILAMWASLGWLMIAQAIVFLVLGVPSLYYAVVRAVGGREAADAARKASAARRTRSAKSWPLIAAALFALALGGLFFWKVNMPIVDFLPR